MAFIFGVARQEADLYKIFRDFITGAARPGFWSRAGAGNGQLNNLILPDAGLYTNFTLTCVSTAPRGGTFGVVSSDGTAMPDAIVGTVYNHEKVHFYIDFGSVDFQLGDSFTISGMTAPAGKARFAYLNGTPDQVGDETYTMTCTVAGQAAIVGVSAAVPAVFGVVSSARGTMPDLTQGVAYNALGLSCLLSESPDSPDQYQVGNQIVVRLRGNPLRAVDQHWDVLRKVPDGVTSQFGNPVSGADAELILHGRGLAGDDDIYYGMTRAFNNANANARWTHYGMAGYIPSLTLPEQPAVQGGLSGVRPVHTFWSLAIPYLIIASGRCFKLLTRSNIYYSQSYAGLIVASTMPKYWGYPYMVGGTGDTRDTMWSSLSSNRSSFWNYVGDTSGGSGYLYNEGYSWRTLWGASGEYSTNGQNIRYYSRESSKCMPHADVGMYDLRLNLDGSVPAFQCRITPNYGLLDGVFAVPGRDGRQPEEIIVMENGQRLYVTQNHHRSGFNDFCAFLLE